MATSRRILIEPVRSRRRVLTWLAAAGLAASSKAHAALGPAERELTRRVEAYLNGITTLTARFTQLAPNGGLATGKVDLQRPGKMRFDYDPPSRVLLIATDWRLVFVDSAAEQLNVIPLSETPPAVLLEAKVALDGDVTVSSVKRQAGEIELSLYKTKAADQGRLVLYFAESPMELRRWMITDAQGLTTTILLENLRTGIPLDPDLFRFLDPQMFGWPK